MKKKTKEIIETTTLAVGVILLSAGCFLQQQRNMENRVKNRQKRADNI